MSFNLKTLAASVEKLLGKADAEFKAELNDIKSTVTTALTQSQAEVSELTTKLASMVTEKASLETTVGELTSKLSASNKEFLGFNDTLTEACLNGKLLDLNLKEGATADEAKAAALALPVADKFKLYQGALNAAFAKANVPNATMPAAPVTSTASSGGAGSMKREAYFKMLPQAQLEFIKNGGRITD